MNNIYKVIWSKAKNCYVVASEIARSHTKSASGSEKIGGVARHALLALGAACAIACGGFVNVGAAVQSETISAGTTSNPVLTVDNTDDAAQLNKVISAARDDKLVTKDNISDQLTGYAKASDLSAKADATTVNDISTRVDKLETTVGNDASGLVKDVAEAKTDITNIKNTIGDDTTGLIKEVNDKANQSDLDAATDRLTTAEGKITKLETQTGEQDTAIKDLQKKTTNISYADGAGTSIDGITVKDGNIVGNGNSAITGLTNVETSQINGKSLTGTTVATEKEVKDVADAVKTETDERKAADTALEEKIAKNTKDIATLDGKVATAQGYIQTNANNIQANSNAIADTNKRTGGIDRNLEDTQTTIEGSVKVDSKGNVKDVEELSAKKITTTEDADLKGNVILGTNAANMVTVNGKADFNEAVNMDNGLTVTNGDTKLKATTVDGKLTAGDADLKNTQVGGTLNVTGDTTLEGALTAKGEAKFTENVTVGKDLTVDGKLNVGKISMKNDELDINGDQHHSATTITADGISNNAKVTDKNGVTTESKFTHDKEGSTTYAKKGDDADWKEATSNVTADGVENIAKDSKGNTSTTRQDSKGIYGYAKDKDGNKSYTKQEGNRIAESVIGQDGKQTKSEMTSTDITNTAKDGIITNTAKNVTNEGTESVTNKVGNNEVKVSQNGVDIKAEDGKKITESVGTASRVVENDKITDEAGDSTVTTEKGKGTTFGKEGSTGTTNIYGDSIKTGKINAEDTTTDKLTAGAAAGVDGGRLTVDAKDGVKGSYKSGDYTSRSYILANTLKSGVDNGKEPIDADFVGSRTDHYMDGDKAKLDETVKDADGSNVTKKTSTDTATTITDGITTTKTEQGTKDITNTATAGTITNDAKVITNKASEVINNEAININNTATGTITSKASEIKNEADKLISNKVGENTWENMEDGKITTSIKNGTKQNLTQSDAEKTEHSVVNGSNSTVNKQTSEEITDAVTNGTTTNVTQNTATSSNNTIADTNGNANTVVSTVDGTKFTNTGANTAIREGTVTDTTIKGNTITTGKVTMDYADVMKDLGVNGNTTLGEVGKDTTLTVNSKATFNNGLTVTNGETKLKNTTIEGTLNVFENATFQKDVTANSFSVNGKTYIDSDGLNANNQVIRNVADGSISEGSKDAVNGGQLYNVKNDLEGKVNKVGANAAAMANLHPMEFDPDSKWNIAAAIGNYGSETAAALGAFYRPNDDVMVNLSTAFGTGENMVGGGVSVRLGKGGNKLSREESNALKDQVNDLTARMDALLSVLNPNMSKDFPDVPENHWAYEAVSRLAGNDIVQGYPDGEFHGERTMTRYEMAEIIYNALSRGAEAEKELVEEFKPELQAMAASEKATAERAEG